MEWLEGSVSPGTIMESPWGIQKKNKRKKNHGNNRSFIDNQALHKVMALIMLFSLLLTILIAESFLPFMSSLVCHFLRNNFLHCPINSSSIQFLSITSHYFIPLLYLYQSVVIYLFISSHLLSHTGISP